MTKAGRRFARNYGEMVVAAAIRRTWRYIVDRPLV